MIKELRPVLVILLVLTALTGLAYPFAVTGAAQALFPRQAAGSLIEKNGRVIGSELLGQSFAQPGYFWGRPSATAEAPYNASASGGSNLAPSAKSLADSVAERVMAFRKANPGETGPVPADLVTASASGLDPHISPAAAEAQVKRVAASRRVALLELHNLVGAMTEGRVFGLLGEPVVNVLKLNLALDEKWPIKK
ncbi:MAG: potassium-transporting ATPase subunit KdpC [Rhodospirillales bacterium]|nr:potassium-transporting ATPase subunit KdpC [Rhodospirillales bacterium]